MKFRTFGRVVTRILAFALIATSLTLPTAAVAAANPILYLIPFPPAPTDAQDAIDTLDDRRAAIAGYDACGGEIEFWLKTRASQSGEGPINQVLSKMLWLHLPGQIHDGDYDPNAVCSWTRTYPTAEISGWKDDDGKPLATKYDLDNLIGPDLTELNRDIAEVMGSPACSNVIRSKTQTTDTVTVTASVTGACLVVEINKALSVMHEDKNHLGSSDLPCYIIFMTDGEWDVTVRQLTRAVYLDGMWWQHPLIRPDVRAHITNDLLAADGRPGLDSYSIFQCGNTERSTGSAEDRAEDSKWTSEALDSVGDIFSWLSKRLLLLFAAASIVAGIVAAANLAGAQGLIANLLVTGVIAGSTAVGLARIPETENHRLNIETSRYLNNQLIIHQLQSDGRDPTNVVNDQAVEMDWLLTQFHDILTRDFREYNARPYTRYSISAILNIADFAEDPAVKMAAVAVLNYTEAKFAIGSSQDRRVVPFRRHLSDVAKVESTGYGLFDQNNEADHLTTHMLFYAGQDQQMTAIPNDPAPQKDWAMISVGAANIMISEATSFYVPSCAVLDAAIQSFVPESEFIHHEGYEVYSRGRGYLITAGGVETEAVNTVKDLGPLGDALNHRDDHGAAFPTTLMLNNSAFNTTLDSFIRIEGKKDKPGPNESFEGNLCVIGNFACGINLVVPNAINNCLVADAGTPPQWEFLDVKSCPAFGADPDKRPFVFVAIYRDACPTSDTGCTSNFGFFEAVDGDDRLTFRKFEQQTLAANPPGFISGMSGTFHTVTSAAVAFEADAYERDPTKSGIVSVDGVPQPSITSWPLASGTIINGGSAKLTIKDPYSIPNSTVTLDLSDKNNAIVDVSPARCPVTR